MTSFITINQVNEQEKLVLYWFLYCTWLWYWLHRTQDKPSMAKTVLNECWWDAVPGSSQHVHSHLQIYFFGQLLCSLPLSDASKVSFSQSAPIMTFKWSDHPLIHRLQFGSLLGGRNWILILLRSCSTWLDAWSTKRTTLWLPCIHLRLWFQLVIQVLKTAVVIQPFLLL